jgi:hypothetical protein
MRIKTIMTACLAVPALSVLCLLSSCSSEELTEKPSTGPQTLTLNLKPAGTRAAVYTDPGTKAENTINSVTIGIFDKNTGNAVKTIQEVAGSLTPSITTSQLVDGDIVLVAVNAKSGTFAGAKTVTDFENKTLAIDDALASSNSSATTVTSNNLPMFGIGTIAGSSPSFSADVTVYHMVAKITLKSLSVNFSTTGAYPAATFTPTEVFMSNVPDALDFYPVVDANMTSYSKFATSSKLYQGESSVSDNLKAYLGTGSDLTSIPTIKNTKLSGVTGGSYYNWGTVSPVTSILYLYTMPSSDATASRLVIKGMFDPDGPGENKAVPVYYPVNINYNSDKGSAVDGGTVKQVYPNKNYIIDVTIQSKGSEHPTDAIDPQTATATITVKDFTTATQSNVFN